MLFNGHADQLTGWLFSLERGCKCVGIKKKGSGEIWNNFVYPLDEIGYPEVSRTSLRRRGEDGCKTPAKF